MNKKIKIVIGVVIVIVLVDWMVFGLDRKEQKTSVEQSEKDEAWENLQISCYNAKIINQKERVELNDCAYTVNSVELTKKQGDWIKPDDSWYQCDAKGNILGDITIIKVNITIEHIKENEDEEKTTVWLNDNYLNLYDKSGKVLDISNEVIAASYSGLNMDKKDCFKISIDVGKSLTTDLIYVVADKSLEQAGYCLLSFTDGAGEKELKPKEHFYIKLDIGELSDESTTEK